MAAAGMELVDTGVFLEREDETFSGGDFKGTDVDNSENRHRARS